VSRIWRAAGIALGVAVLLAGGACGLLWYLVYGDRSHPAHGARVVIARGSTFDEIATKLAEAGVIGNVLTFRALARMREQDVAVRAGEYHFDPHRTQNEILQALVTGGAQVAAWVTIPEGFTAAQIAARLHAEGIGETAAFAREFLGRSIVVDATRTKNLEGFLFPSTYLVPLDATPSQVADMLLTQFFKELPGDAERRARALHVTIPQAVTIASLVEREAKTAPDRPQIAAVIYNRLRLGMPLQIDAAIEYALPHHKTELSFADLKLDSPYNTYARAGLPPTPIANPGLPSLEAALHPSKSPYLYYVYCGNGRHVFARTLAQHQANVARCLQ
jgi:peptidoglycan lytic transglycosylase G